jgi:hypothetical protein
MYVGGLKLRRSLARAIRENFLTKVRAATAQLGLPAPEKIPTGKDVDIERLRAASMLQITDLWAAVKAHDSTQNNDFIAGMIWHDVVWAEIGCPAFVLSQGLTASLLLTDPMPRPPEEFKLPFEAIQVILPPEVPLDFIIRGETTRANGLAAVWLPMWKRRDQLDRYMAAKEPREVLAAVEMANVGNMLYSEIQSRDGHVFHFIDPPTLVADAEWLAGSPQAFLDHGDKEAMALKNRLLLNLFDYIECDHGQAELALAMRQRFQRERTIHLGRDIHLPSPGKFLRSLSTDRLWSIEHRYMVRGHWRMQPHGPDRSLRKRIWILPFWKGPADAQAAIDRNYRTEEAISS